MTFEEEDKEENVMAETRSVFDVNDSVSELLQNNDTMDKWKKEDSVRSKMEAMQKRIDELKEKVKNEGELFCSNDAVFGQDILGSKSSDSLIDVKSKDSLCQDSNNLEDKLRENDEHSDKSLYYSASSYSMCSVSSNSSDSNFCSFTKFVNNFMKNQNHKERLNLLQLHSKKQISLNMMKTSLLELETRCNDELELVERSLNHLNKLAVELNVDNCVPEGEVNSCKLKYLDFNSSGDGGQWKPMTKASLKWLPSRDGSKTELELSKDLSKSEV